MPVNICLLALIGLPGAGKTSLSRWLAKNTCPFHIIHFCYDDLMQFPTAQAPKLDFDFKEKRLEVLDSIINCVRSLKTGNINSIQHQLHKSQAASENYLLICDDNNYYRSMRYKLYQLCRAEQVAFAQIYITLQEQVMYQRNEERAENEQLPLYVLRDMALRLEAPESHKYAWEATTLVISGQQDWPTCLEFIVDSFVKIPAALSELVERAGIETELHQLDLLLRKRLNEILEGVANKAQRAIFLNAKRKEILKIFKSQGTKDLFTYVEMLH